MTTATTISIHQDGHWAGNGRLVDGYIQDCAAILGPAGLPHDDGRQQEAAEAAYAAIEAAIADGEDECTHDGCAYSWDITTASRRK